MLRSLNVVGLRGFALSVPLSILFVTFSFTQFVFIRFVLALSFLLFLPGFNVLEVLYSRTPFLSNLQRFLVSVALSVGIVIVDNYLLTYLGLGINLPVLVYLLTTETLAISAAPIVLRLLRRVGNLERT